MEKTPTANPQYLHLWNIHNEKLNLVTFNRFTTCTCHAVWQRSEEADFFLDHLTTNLHVAPPNYLLYQNSSSRTFIPFNTPTMRLQLFPLKRQGPECCGLFSLNLLCNSYHLLQGLCTTQRTLVGSVAHRSILLAKAPIGIAVRAMLCALPHYPREEKGEGDLSVLLQPAVDWGYKLGLCTGIHPLYLPLTQYLENIANFKTQPLNKYLLYPPVSP